MSNLDKIITSIMAIILIVMIIFGFNHAIKKSEYNECLKWEKQSKEYVLFYSTQWQKDQCKTFNINLK